MADSPEDRSRRLSQALRANLRRRKAQARERAEPPGGEAPGEAADDTDTAPPARPDEDERRK